MMQHVGKVPNFSLKPHPGVMLAMVINLVCGILISLAFYSKEDGTGTHAMKGHLVLIVSGIITICLVLVATAKMWHPHLWKKNSSHKRHQMHTQYHPTKQGMTNNSEPFSQSLSKRHHSRFSHRHSKR